MSPLPPRLLTDDDNLAEFNCGTTSIDEWLARQALKSQRSGDARTYISIDADSKQIAGFYSLSAWGINRTKVRGWLGRNAPTTIPVILIGRLATSTQARGIGLGRSLLIDATRKAKLAAEAIGARALVAEALDAEAGEFYLHNGFSLIPDTENIYAFSLRN